jgi:hypothetical protein
VSKLGNRYRLTLRLSGEYDFAIRLISSGQNCVLDRKLAGHNSGGGDVHDLGLITIIGNRAFLIAVRNNFIEERKPSYPTGSYITPSVSVATNTSATVMILGK